MGREGCHVGKAGCLPSKVQHLGREGCHVGKGNEKKNLGTFGATICMAGSYWPLATKWARRARGEGGSRTKTEETPQPVVHVPDLPVGGGGGQGEGGGPSFFVVLRAF